MKKRGGKSANMYVMFGLLAVLFISLGYLSMQSKEGFKEGADDTTSDITKIASAIAAAGAGDKKEKEEEEEKKEEKAGFRNRFGGRNRQGFRVREGMEMACPEGKSRKLPGGPCN
jgi:hypothetical protein